MLPLQGVPLWQAMGEQLRIHLSVQMVVIQAGEVVQEVIRMLAATAAMAA
jgi:hypothetical protein